MRYAITILTLLSLALTGCRSANPDLGGVPGQELRDLPRVVDSNPDPRVVEFTLTAAPSPYEFQPGAPTTLWLYNGQLPGPLIEAQVGDEIVVHFQNDLPEATTIHWHGIRLPQAMDGTHASQVPVPPGGSFEYRFRVPDAGLFWYHPHHHAAAQVPLGLYGPLLVREPGESELNRERLLVLSDVELDSGGQFVPQGQHMDQLANALGPEGNTLLINGQIEPGLTLRPGSRERWRIVNCAGSRYFQLSATGVDMTLIGSDSGLIDRHVELDDLLLVPGERADVVIDAPAEGDPGALLNLPYTRLIGVEYPQEPLRRLAGLSLAGAPVNAPPTLPPPAVIPELPEPGASHFFLFNARLIPTLEELYPPAGGHAASMHHGGTEDDNGPIADFMINGALFPDVPRFEAQLGAVEEWTVQNHTPMDHPFHMHGFRFQVLSVDEQELPYRGWRDTVNIPTNAQGDAELKLRVRYDGFPGRWVWHCHILHHAEMGMMAEFDVLP